MRLRFPTWWWLPWPWNREIERARALRLQLLEGRVDVLERRVASLQRMVEPGSDQR